MNKLFLSIISILVFSNAQSKWTVLSSVATGINSISVVSPSVIWLACKAGNVFRSTDGGSTFIIKNSGLPAGDIYGISALDTLNCWVGTDAGSIYRTSNGGLNWVLQFSLAGSFSNGIKMFSLNYGVYSGDPTGNGQPFQFRYTTNGGTNWILSPEAPIAMNEFGVINAWDWTDTSHFWIGSANVIPNATTAKIFKTVNGFGGGGWTSATVSGVGGNSG
ncbi:MAG: YCF48-related protein, partial [Bacteroidota bacterium]|nr:YCF48-related protein [Bacteroidota bacterium]